MRIGLIGYGKMGKSIEKIAIQEILEVSHKIEDGDPLTNLIENPPDVAIEFTQPTSAFNNLKFCLENNIPVISGTTGWLDHYEEIISLCQERNGTFLYSSNFGIGVNLFFELNEWLARRAGRVSFDVSIEETHHTEKKDSPSGTAITLAEGIIKNDSTKTGWTQDRSSEREKVFIESKRIPDVPGTHLVTYSSDLETIEIKHTAHSRDLFAKGVIEVAKWIHTKKGVFTMEDFLNER